MKTITLVIPTYNEDGRINKTMDCLKNGLKFRGLRFTRVVFSDDGSADRTVEFLKKQKRSIEKELKTKVDIIISSENLGKGHAVRTAAITADTDYVLYTDADFSTPLFNLKSAMLVAGKNTDLVLGSKKMPGAMALVKRDLVRTIVGYGHSLVVWAVLGEFAWDFHGGFKLFSRRLVKEVLPMSQINSWGFDTEIVFLARKLGYKTVEFPVVWSHMERDSKIELLRDSWLVFKDTFRILINWLAFRYASLVSGIELSNLSRRI